MRLTNKYGVPEALVRAVSKAMGGYTRGRSDYTVTELPKPPRMLRFERAAGPDGVTQDVTDLMDSFIGTAVHSFIEDGTQGDELSEERLYLEIDGVVVGGKFDHYEHDNGGVVRDWKVTKAKSYSFDKGKPKPEHSSQGNCNALLLREAGLPVQRIEVVNIYKDWTAAQARYAKEYPPSKVVTLPIEDWGAARTKAWISSRVAMHEAVKSSDPESLPICSPEDRWQQPTVYAVVSPDRKTAHRLLDSEADAKAWGAENIGGKKQWSVEFRPGVDLRCASYCPVRDICSHGRKQSAAAEAA